MKTIMFLFALVLGATAVNAQTRTSIKVSDLPKAVTDNIATQHQGWNTLEAFKVDNKGVTTYDVIVKKQQSEMTLMYDKDGKYLKMEPRKTASSGSKMKHSEHATHASATPAKPKK